MDNTKIKQVVIFDIIVVLFIALIEYAVFHNLIGTSNLLGDSADGRLIALISEHWYQFFLGNETLTELHGAFYPAENVLAYSDIFLPIGIIASLFRIAGVSAFTAFKYTIIIFHFTGGVVFYFHMRYQHRVRVIPGVIATLVFTYSSFIMVQNIQIITVTTLSLCLVFLYNLLQAKKRSVRIINGILFVVTWALELYNAFYVAYMFALQLLMFFIVAIVVMIIKNRDMLLTYIRRWYEYVIYLLVMAVSMIPFIYLYLPIFNSEGGRNWDEIYVLPISQLFYNGLTNYAIDNSLEDVHSGYSVIGFEGAFPIVTTIVVIALIIFGVVLAIKKKFKSDITLIITLLVSTIVIFIFGVSIEGNTLWKLLYSIVPGASTIRAQQRWLVVMLIPLAILLGKCSNVLEMSLENKGRVAVSAGLILVGILFLYENIYWPGYTSVWNEEDAKKFEAYVKSPPSDCRVFYIANGDKDLGNVYVKGTSLMTYNDKIHLDAMVIANKYHLKTLNGYSGLTPAKWKIRSMPDNDTRKQAMQWLSYNNIKSDGVYEYNMIDNTWDRVEY